MNSNEDYLAINKNTWNTKTPVHLNSEFYGLEEFIKGKTSLKQIELDLLGEVKGKKILHLQCHFGQDTLSLARMGAEVTGVDFSDTAIKEANLLTQKINQSARFICCDVYSLPEHLDEEFDLVYTSYGTIGWLPDLNKWAQIIHRFLKPGGKFVFVEFHPVVWMFDDNFKEIKYNYFNVEAIVESENGTYAQPDSQLKTESVSWNHSMAEVLDALLQNKINLLSMKEYNYSPYSCFKNMVETNPERFHIRHLGEKIPMVYSVVGLKTELKTFNVLV